jgi:hypothetical protein
MTAASDLAEIRFDDGECWVCHKSRRCVVIETGITPDEDPVLCLECLERLASDLREEANEAGEQR